MMVLKMIKTNKNKQQEMNTHIHKIAEEVKATTLETSKIT